MPVNLAVVPVAGLGTRLLPATKSQPKEMLPVGRKPVVQYVVEELTRVGVDRVLFVTGPGKTSIENHFDLNAELTQVLRETGKEDLLEELAFEHASAQFFYTRQRQLRGLGHAVLCARTFVGRQPFVVALGDSIIGLHASSDVVGRMIRTFETTGAAAVVAFEEVPLDEVSHYGIALPGPEQDGVFALRTRGREAVAGGCAEHAGDRGALRVRADDLRRARAHRRPARAVRSSSPTRSGG